MVFLEQVWNAKVFFLRFICNMPFVLCLKNSATRNYKMLKYKLYNMSLLAYQLLALIPINEFPIGLILFLGDRFQIYYIERLVFVFLFVLEKI